MRIITVQFDYDGQDDYKRLYTAFKNSCAIHASDSELICLHLSPPIESRAIRRSFISNTIKLEAWIRALKESSEDTLLVDCDMIMTAPIDDVWDMDFDIAYTYREEGRKSKVQATYKLVKGRKVRTGPKPHPDAIGLDCRDSRWPPINGGVMFIRPTEKSISFIQKQLEINNKMMNDKAFHNKWRAIYCGINQAAFGYMLETNLVDCNLLKLNCTEWNSCDGTWHLYEEGFTRMVHIKSALRWYVLGKTLVPTEYKKLVNLWNKYEQGDVEVLNKRKYR